MNFKLSYFFIALSAALVSSTSAMAAATTKAPIKLAAQDEKVIMSGLLPCWHPALPIKKTKSVSIRVELNPDTSVQSVGMLSKQDFKRMLNDVDYRAAALAAIEATKACGARTFSVLPKDKYALWSVLEISFDIKQAMQYQAQHPQQQAPQKPERPKEMDLLDPNSAPPL